MGLKWLNLIQYHFQWKTFALVISINNATTINIFNTYDVGAAKVTLY